MLKSNSVADALIERFDLKAYYSTKLRDETRKRLAGDSRFSPRERDHLHRGRCQGPKLAADLANAYVAELHRLTTTLAVTEAAQRRVFFERQLAEARRSCPLPSSTSGGHPDRRSHQR